VVLERIPRVRDIRTMERLLVDIGSEIQVDEERETMVTNTKDRIAGSAVRTGEDDARVEPGARAAGGGRDRARVSCPADARSARGPSTFIWPVWKHLGAEISRSTAISKPSRPMD
jgi:UDP-N-acetylglucosamine enolpyruvyl transferase